MVGPGWIDAKDNDVRRRLNNPDDFVRAEIETALSREIAVVPLLVRGGQMPSAEELPESLKDFAFRNAVKIRADPDFHGDMDRLSSMYRPSTDACAGR